MFINTTDLEESLSFDISQRVETDMAETCPITKIEIDTVKEALNGKSLSDSGLSMNNNELSVPVFRKEFNSLVYVRVFNKVKNATLQAPLI